jgi:hypothetical protein
MSHANGLQMKSTPRRWAATEWCDLSLVETGEGGVDEVLRPGRHSLHAHTLVRGLMFERMTLSTLAKAEQGRRQSQAIIPHYGTVHFRFAQLSGQSEQINC